MSEEVPVKLPPRKERDPYVVHPMYTGKDPVDPSDFIIVDDEKETGSTLKLPIRFNVIKPTDPVTGESRDQTNDAANNMAYAASLDLPTLKKRLIPRPGRALIIGGAPSIKDHIDIIKELARDPNNEIFAINWSHTWLLKHGIVPKHCVFFEIDPEPETIIQARHPDITYYICCHCNRKTFDSLDGYKRVLWHTYPNSNYEKDVNEALFPNVELVGGGITTFTRTLTIALFLGFRHLDLFGCDSSFPDESESTHVEGYETVFKPEVDGLFIYAKNMETGETRRFKTTGVLALQHEEFKEYCNANHAYFSLKVWGDSLLSYTHRMIAPANYTDSDEFYLTKKPK